MTALGGKADIRLRPGAEPFMMRCFGRARTSGGTMTNSRYLAAQVAVGLLLATAAQAETHTFVPTQFYNTYSFAHPPALHIKSGDRVLTKTIDAEGVDWNGKQVAPRANPETGPFYIEGAEPGDVIVVTSTNPKPTAPWPFGQPAVALHHRPHCHRRAPSRSWR
jgi:hypothetical protein